jgi:hypothetical protein
LAEAILAEARFQRHRNTQPRQAEGNVGRAATRMRYECSTSALAN